MPKDRSQSDLLSARSGPYARSSKHADLCGSKNNFPSQGNEREWKEARCAICMEHPHNAVLLLCSSHEKGCRSFMCDTSHRHSNCLDQFRKSSPSIQQIDLSDDFPRSNNIRKLGKLPCPLCRGQISGCMVLEPARTFMNLKRRSCSLESCDFIGTYPELRTHARREHPYVCPTKVDPTRQEEWARLENETTFQDLLGLSRDRDLDWNPIIDNYSVFFEEFEPDSNWEESMEPDNSPFFENNDLLSLEIEHELPYTFLEIPFFHSDPYCPHHTSVERSPQWRFQPVNRELSRSTSENDNTTREYSSRRTNSGRGPGQQNRRL